MFALVYRSQYAVEYIYLDSRENGKSAVGAPCPTISTAKVESKIITYIEPEVAKSHPAPSYSWKDMME
jgi:hypothetical protein